MSQFLMQNLNEVINRLRGEAQALQAEPEFRGSDFFRGRLEALHDAAEAVGAAMRADEPILFDAYQGV